MLLENKPKPKNGNGNGNGHWHIDKRIPAIFIVTVVLQTVAVVWWAAHLDARVKNLEVWANNNRPLIEKINRLEERIDGIRDLLERIEKRL